MTRVALLGPTRHPVAEPYAGGQESHVATLAAALRRQGDHVVLYAAAGTDPALADELVVHARPPSLSQTAALDPQLPEPTFLADQHAYLGVVGDLLGRRDELDVVHNSSLHHLPLVAARAVDLPHVLTLHTPPFPWLEVGAALADPRVSYVAVSEDLAGRWSTLPERPRVVDNGVDLRRFPAGAGGAALVWLGRLVPEKGADIAVSVARAVGLPLVLAGPISDTEWFEGVLAPRFGDGVSYAGHLGQDEAARLVGSSAVLLATPRWDEPFGLVAVEAALTGTPVLAADRGGLAAVVRRGLGVVAEPATGDPATVRALVQALPHALSMSRAQVRACAVEGFSAEAMARAYSGVYADATARWAGGASRNPDLSR